MFREGLVRPSSDHGCVGVLPLDPPEAIARLTPKDTTESMVLRTCSSLVLLVRLSGFTAAGTPRSREARPDAKRSRIEKTCSRSSPTAVPAASSSAAAAVLMPSMLLAMSFNCCACARPPT